MDPIPANQIITVSLSAEEWNVVLMLMMEAPTPYRVAGPVITRLRDELHAKAQQNVSE